MNLEAADRAERDEVEALIQVRMARAAVRAERVLKPIAQGLVAPRVNSQNAPHAAQNWGLRLCPSDAAEAATEAEKREAIQWAIARTCAFMGYRWTPDPRGSSPGYLLGCADAKNGRGLPEIAADDLGAFIRLALANAGRTPDFWAWLADMGVEPAHDR